MPVPKEILYLTKADVQQTLTVAEAVDLAEKEARSLSPAGRGGRASWRRRACSTSHRYQLPAV